MSCPFSPACKLAMPDNSASLAGSPSVCACLTRLQLFCCCTQDLSDLPAANPLVSSGSCRSCTCHELPGLLV